MGIRGASAAASASHEIYRRAGLSDHRLVGMGRLAIALLGERCLKRTRDLRAPPVRIERSPWRFTVRSGADGVALTMAVSLGLATWWSAGESDPHAPKYVHDLAAHLALPVPALRDHVARHGTDPEAIARCANCPRWLAVFQLRHVLQPLRRCAADPLVRSSRAWTPKIVAGGR